MTKHEPRKVARVYSILDKLNVHKHNAFKTIVFSDTILVYNPEIAKTDQDRDYLVWYLIEFAEDLHHRLTGQDIYFRAILTSGSFNHYQLENINCFFGLALVNAYLSEKNIPSLGLFIDNHCNKHNLYFKVSPFDKDLSFVYLNRSLEDLNKLTGGYYPSKDSILSDLAPYVPWQVNFLKDLYDKMRGHDSPIVRTKFLTAWDFYAKRYPSLVKALTESNFSLSSLAPENTWIDESKAMENDIKRYKRIGSGTQLSIQLRKQVRQKKS
ncbi:hypothetical protein SH16_01431 [Aeromonas caviae]|uniref:hypothetical protein n=1 Tax=Aeromonas caviae TaxID=648 RepID=UPI0006589F97|nr:hypothetical protein [Aeromonas caviae]KLV47698.1 hypothetical protein SH16_01431 [Aeromonas caviae]